MAFNGFSALDLTISLGNDELVSSLQEVGANRGEELLETS
jgi:hypothetical protein